MYPIRRSANVAATGNATGVYFLSGGLGEKRLGLIRELLPRAELVGLLLFVIGWERFLVRKRCFTTRLIA